MMPAATLRYCTHAGCRELVPSGRCTQHQQQAIRTYDRARGTATQRGYGVRWSRYRAWFLNQWPLCGDRPSGAKQTNDSQCLQQGLYVKANVVDHIVPVTGPDDVSFYEPTAHQALCTPCHDAKRGRERNGGGGLMYFLRDGQNR